MDIADTSRNNLVHSFEIRLMLIAFCHENIHIIYNYITETSQK